MEKNEDKKRRIACRSLQIIFSAIVLMFLTGVVAAIAKSLGVESLSARMAIRNMFLFTAVVPIFRFNITLFGRVGGLLTGFGGAYVIRAIAIAAMFQVSSDIPFIYASIGWIGLIASLMGIVIGFKVSSTMKKPFDSGSVPKDAVSGWPPVSIQKW